MVRRTPRSPSRPSRCLASLVLAGAFACVPLRAAELGEPRVSSHIGQPLVADIELTMLEDPGAPVQVRLASPEVYNGAGIAIPPALATLNLSVMRRDGRQFLHATTLRSVDAEHLHLYLELVDKGQRVVRLATLWLTPDPHPAPPPVRVPAPAPAPAPVAAPVPLAAVAAVAAPVVAPAAPARPAAPPAVIPARPEPKRIALPAPAPRLALPGAQAPAHPPSCQRQSDDAKACTALGEKNADLRVQLAKLEDKVKGLQAALGARQGEAGHAAPAVAPSAKAEAPHGAAKPAMPAPAKEAAHEEAAHGADAHAAPDPARAGAEPAEKPSAGQAKPDAEAPKPDIKPDIKPAGPKPIHAIKPLVPRKPKDKEKEAQEEGGLPWGWIGGALALLGLGAGGVVLARRKTPANVDIPAPGLLDRLRQRFAARTRPASAPPAQAVREAEPSLE